MSTKSGMAGPVKRLEFRYDYMGRRIRKNVYNTLTGGTPQESRVFLYEGWNLIAEFDGSQSNALLRTYTWGLDLSGSRHGAGGTGGLLIVQDHEGASPENHFAAYDGAGNVVGLINSETGEKSATYEYSPFGELIRVSGEMGMKNTLRYSSRYTDDETGLLYYGYRYYSPALGKWLSPDPIEESGGMNVFGFLGNDPVNAVDVLGMFGSGGGNWWPAPRPTPPDPKPERDPRYHDYQWGVLGIELTPELQIHLIEAAEAATKQTIDLLVGYETVQAIQRGDVLQAAYLAGMEFTVGKFIKAFKLAKKIGQFFTWCCKKVFLRATKAVIEWVKSVGRKKPCPNAPNIGYHATHEDIADTIVDSGEFWEGGGRVGRGQYVADTPEGALAEFRAHHGNKPAGVIEIEYDEGRNLDIRGTQLGGYKPSVRQGNRLAVESSADSITYHSIREGGSTNVVIRNKSGRPARRVR